MGKIDFSPSVEGTAIQKGTPDAIHKILPNYFMPEGVIASFNRSTSYVLVVDATKQGDEHTVNEPSIKTAASEQLHTYSGAPDSSPKSYNEHITAYSTLALAFVTAALAIYTFRLWRETKLMVLASSKTAEGQLRAYMFLDHYKYFSHLDTSNNTIWWSIHPVWRNGGVTPATSVSFNTSVKLLNDEMSDDFELLDSDGHPLETVVGPNSAIQARPISITSDDLIAIREGTKHFYIWGSATYNDVFPNTPKRITKFCNQIHAVLGDPSKEYDRELNIVEIVIGSYSRNNYMADVANPPIR